jgi:CRP-like cAMP-binding protein
MSPVPKQQAIVQAGPQSSACRDWWEGLAPASVLGYPAKVKLFRQGDFAESAYFLKFGLVKLVCVDSKGREVIVGLRSSGRLLGAAAVVLNQPYPTAATTITHCQLARISADEIRQLLNTKVEFSRHLHQLHAQEVHDHLRNMVELASSSAEYRLSKLFAELASGTPSPPGGIGTSIPFKQWEIAELLAITPEHTSRILRRMEQRGLVMRSGGHIFVPDLARLVSSLE